MLTPKKTSSWGAPISGISRKKKIRSNWMKILLGFIFANFFTLSAFNIWQNSCCENCRKSYRKSNNPARFKSGDSLEPRVSSLLVIFISDLPFCRSRHISVADNNIKILQKTYFNSKKKITISSILWNWKSKVMAAYSESSQSWYYIHRAIH